jgi:YD repeat-containing protein
VNAVPIKEWVLIEKPSPSAHDSVTGRLVSITDPNGKVQRFGYEGRYGEQDRTWGTAGYPVRYEFDYYGRRWAMHTYRGGDDQDKWNQEDWPGTEPAADTTTWTYDEATGLTTGKTNAAGTGEQASVGYSYTVDGKLHQRTWARGVTTTYAYYGEGTGEPRTGELHALTYSDGTPAVTLTYDRLGRPREVWDAVTGGPEAGGGRTFHYRGEDESVAAERRGLQLWQEEIVAGTGGLYSRTIARD